MKYKKFLLFHLILLITACILLALAGSARIWDSLAVGYWAMDIKLRINEVSCIHDGTDPFDIFERKLESDKYRGFGRPDMPPQAKDHRKAVHAYPAWHMAVFWWYGYLSPMACIAIMAIAYACSLVWVCKWTSVHLQKKEPLNYTLDILFLLSMFFYPFGGICWTMNYGLLLAGFMLLLFQLLEQKHDMIAGIVYSFIMLKPQIGVLLLIPLFVGKRYKTIALAGAICILETLFISWKLNKSPVELILQLPKIGAPYSKGFFADTLISIFGSSGQYISMGAFVGLAVVGCYFVRIAKETWVRFIPAVAVIPFWTYSCFHDWLSLLPCFLFIVNNRQKYPWLYELSFCGLILYSVVTFSYTRGWYSIGKMGFAAILLFVIVSPGCIMAVMNTSSKSDWSFFRRFLFKHSTSPMNK